MGKYQRFKGSLRSTIAVLAALSMAFQITACSSAAGELAPATQQASSASRQLKHPETLHSTGTESSSAPVKKTPVSSALASSAPGMRKAPAKTSSGVQTAKKIEQTPETLKIQTFSVSKSEPKAGTYGHIDQRAGYQYLKTDMERTLYSLIAQSVYQVGEQQSKGYYPTGQISVTGRLTEAQIRITLMAFLNDNPQVFWIANAYSYGFKGNETILQMYSFLPQSECNTAIQAFNSRVQSIVQVLTQGISEFQREEILFDYLVKHCSYDNEAASNSNEWQAYTAYGALINGKAVCEGYSRAMQLLCSYAGIPCILLRGTSDGVGHMWNGIKIDGNWYHLDTTWCDNTILIYSYFNVTDAVIRQTHNVGPAVSTLTDAQICAKNTQYNITLPACTSTKANYFQVKGIKITKNPTPDDDAVVQAIVPLLAEGKITLTFHIDPSMDFDSTVKHLVSGKDYIMYNYLLRASQSAGKSLDLQKTSYVTDKADSGLNVHIFYR